MRKRKSIKERFESKIQVTPSCWIWMASLGGKNKYGQLGTGVGTKTAFAHRISYELYVGAIPDGLYVLHKCDIPQCVNPDHLFLGTHSDNMKDMTLKGRRKGPPIESMKRGEAHKNAKLTAEEVIAIRLDTRNYSQISRDYGVSSGHVKKIKDRERWGSIK